jgi:hypothetical protein
MRLLQIALSLTLTVAATPAAHAGLITTLFASDNYGSAGGAVYFDVNAFSALTITGLDVNTSWVTPFSLSIYTTPGTAFGKESDPSLWTLVASGSGTGAGDDHPSAVTLASPFGLSAGASYGFALVLSGIQVHEYTNGNGANQFYSNADLALSLGSATNVPFGFVVFTPRVWNGTIYYTTGGAVPEPSTVLLLGAGLLSVAAARRRFAR